VSRTDRVELADEQFLVAEVKLCSARVLARRGMGGLDGVHVLHGELDGAVDHQFLRQPLGAFAGGTKYRSIS
jgi:hypothetical protein